MYGLEKTTKFVICVIKIKESPFMYWRKKTNRLKNWISYKSPTLFFVKL